MARSSSPQRGPEGQCVTPKPKLHGDLVILQMSGMCNICWRSSRHQQWLKMSGPEEWGCPMLSSQILDTGHGVTRSLFTSGFQSCLLQSFLWQCLVYATTYWKYVSFFKYGSQVRLSSYQNKPWTLNFWTLLGLFRQWRFLQLDWTESTVKSSCIYGSRAQR